MDWNTIVTVRPGPQHEHELLGALARFGRFRPTHFPDVCVGQVSEIGAFLEALRTGLEAHARWTAHIGRVIPADAVFPFTSETLTDRLKQAVAPLVARMTEGSFCVRLERRGLAGKVRTQEIEAVVGDHVNRLAGSQGTRLRIKLDDPDFVIAAETLGQECGISLLPRASRQRYPFLRTR